MNLKKVSISVAVVLFLAIAFIWLNKYIEKQSDEYRFTNIYKKKLWHSGGSGAGSDPENAQLYMSLLQKTFEDPRFETIIDLGSGDWRLMEKINIPDTKFYKGFDIVKTVVEAANNKHQKSNVQFYHIHDLSEFKEQKADLLIIKDVMQHWSNERIIYFINNILPNFKYALITNDFAANQANIDIKVGHFRPLDLQAEPFNMKDNLEVVADYESHGIAKRILMYSNPK